MSGNFTPGPWRAEGPDEFGDFNIHEPTCQLAVAAVVYNMRPAPEVAANAKLIAASPCILAELKAAVGHLLNAKIDLETGAPKATAIRTIDGGLNRARAAIAKATGERAYEERVG